MSLSSPLCFSDFDGAWRYSSATSTGTARPLHFIHAGTSSSIRIRAPITGSLNLTQPDSGTIARRRTRSDATPLPAIIASSVHASAGAQRSISAILMSFAPIAWTASDEGEPHPGVPADLPREGSEDVEAVSPKSRLPGALSKALGSRQTDLTVCISEPDEGVVKRLGSSLVAVKSPYPRPEEKAIEKLRRWVRRVVAKLRR